MAIFSEYGTVIDIVAKTNVQAKGQAFIVFDSPDAAQRAVNEVNGFQIFDKPMNLAMAKTRSDATVLKTGTDDEFELHKRRRMAEKGVNHHLSSGFPARNRLMHTFRQKEGPRSCRRTKATQKTGRSCSRAGCRKTIQSFAPRPQVHRSRCKRPYPRRVSAPEQDPVRAKPAGGLRCGGCHCHIWSLRGVP